MRKERTLFVLGIWVAIVPFLGFTNAMRKGIFMLTGIALIYLAYLFYIQTKARARKDDTRMKSFVDNVDTESAL